MRLRKPCEHDRYEQHGYKRLINGSLAPQCPGGEFLPEDALVIERENGEWKLTPRGWHVLNAAAAFGVPGGSKVCPECHSAVYDNRDENRARQAKGQKARPAFKCKSCEWIAWEANAFDDSDGLIVDKGTGEIVEAPVLRDEYSDLEAPF